MPLFAELQAELMTYLDEHQVEGVARAYQIALDAHQGQLRRSGEPYISHPVAVAHILASMRMDQQSIMAAILHDVIEDTPISKETLTQEFGQEVADLVDGVSKLTQINFESHAEAQAENFRKMVLAMVRDIRVILVKLADRLHNMRTLHALPLYKQRRIARETLEIYAPIANRLGMHSFRIELEDLGFAALYPQRYRVLKEAVRRVKRNRRHIVTQIETEIKEFLEQQQFPPCAVWGREKHLYSIYQKMRDKHLSFTEVMDVYAFRIVVDTIDTCYRTLGAVHHLYKPLTEHFKDYIAIPKANGYQSLHTTLFGPHSIPLEIQIRTADMNNIAENGIAAHWLYKTNTKPGAAHEAELRAQAWLKGLLEMQTTTGNSLEFIENVKIDLFPDEVYIFTPKGKILELIKGATPVDFAYAIHSDIGNSCVAAKVDRHLAPLSMPLLNGQTVEIITAPGARPNPAWLQFVVTGKAKTKIRHYLKTQQRTEAMALGKNLLEKSLAAFSATWEQLSSEKIETALQELHYKTLEDLHEAIGLGNETAVLVATRFLGIQEDGKNKTKGLSSKNNLQPLLIQGCDGIVTHFAECCYPIPGDLIIGLLHKGRGLFVHTETCRKVSGLQGQPEKSVNLNWAEKIKGEFKTSVRVEALNQRGVLAQLANAIADANSNIEDIHLADRDCTYSTLEILLAVHDRIHLAHIIRKLRRIKAVAKIYRSR